MLKKYTAQSQNFKSYQEKNMSTVQVESEVKEIIYTLYNT